MFGKSFVRRAESLQEYSFTSSQDELMRDQNTDEEGEYEQDADPTGSCLGHDQIHGYYKTGHTYIV